MFKKLTRLFKAITGKLISQTENKYRIEVLESELTNQKKAYATVKDKLADLIAQREVNRKNIEEAHKLHVKLQKVVDKSVSNNDKEIGIQALMHLKSCEEKLVEFEKLEEFLSESVITLGKSSNRMKNEILSFDGKIGVYKAKEMVTSTKNMIYKSITETCGSAIDTSEIKRLSDGIEHDLVKSDVKCKMIEYESAMSAEMLVSDSFEDQFELMVAEKQKMIGD
jgi:phage shock protein A